MRNSVLWSLAAVACSLSASVDLTACGDKYLRLANRLGPAYTAERQATVLLYTPSDSAAHAGARRLGLKGTLERAGHRVYAVEADADLEVTLQTRVYDVIIADTASAGVIGEKLARAAGKPTLLPILHNAPKREVEMARKQQGCLISSRETAVYAAAEVDHVMELRKTAQP